jgi:hypothetical protein
MCIHQNLRYCNLSGNHLSMVIIYKKKKNDHIEKFEKKVSCWNKCSVFRSDIEIA